MPTPRSKVLSAPAADPVAGPAPDAEQREVSLSQRMDAVVRAFYQRFDDYEAGVLFLVRDLFERTLIAYACHLQQHFRVGYTWDDADGATFDVPDAWQRVTLEWVPADRAAAEAAKRALMGEPPAEATGDAPTAVADEPPVGAERQADDVAGESWDDCVVTGYRAAPAIHLPDDYTPAVGDLYHRDVTPQITRSADGRRTAVTINTASPDRHRTIILPTGAMLDSYRANPVVLINHDYGLPVATSTVGVRGTGPSAVLQANIEDAAWDTDDPEAVRWRRKIERGIVRAASIGALFHEVIPGREYDGIEELLGRAVRPNERLPAVIVRWELVEWSFVTVPSNPLALVTARAAGLAALAERQFQVSLSGLADRLAAIQSQLAAVAPAPAPSAPTGAPAADATPPAANPTERTAPETAAVPPAVDGATTEAPASTTTPTPPALPPVPSYRIVTFADVERATAEAEQERRRRERRIALTMLGRA